MAKKSEGENCGYDGAVVLGLNDALIELSGALVGLSFALADTRLIAMVGLITGFAAALSMAASEYLSAKEDKRDRPVIAAAHTGFAYLLVVIVLVLPYFLITNAYTATAAMFGLIICVIAGYTKYTTSKNGMSFRKKFGEMFAISVVVAVISFAFGSFVRSIAY